MTYSEPVVELVGVVHPSGSGGGKDGPGDSWSLNFRFVAWRGPDGQLQERDLLLSQPDLTGEELRAAMREVNAYDIFRVRARFADPQPYSELRLARLVERLGPDGGDAELTAYAERLQRPVTVTHPTLGTFTLNRRHDWYEAEIDWPGRPVRLCLDRDAAGPAFDAAARLWAERASWNDRCRRFATERLLELKNDGWLDESELPVTAEQFAGRIELGAIHMHPDGRFEFSFDDGDLFWGHVIQVGGTLADGPTRAHLGG